MGVFLKVLGRLSLFQRILIPAAFMFLTGYPLIVYTVVKSLMIYHQTTISDETSLMLDALEKQTAEQVVIGDYTLINNLLRDRVKRGAFKRLAFTDSEGLSLVAQREEVNIESPEWFNRWLDIPEQPISREVKIGGRLYGTISAQLSHSEFHNQIWENIVKQIWIAVAGGILFLIYVSFIIRSSLKPLRNVQEIARKAASGDLSVAAQLSDGSAPEIREAITLFNEAAASIDYHLRERIESLLHKLAEHQQDLEQIVKERTQQLLDTQEDLVRKEKLAILGQLSGSVGHELRNPLGVMSNAVYFLKMVLADADETVKEYLDIIKNEIDNSLRIITDLLDFARTKAPRIKTVTARELTDESLGRCAIPENIDLQTEIPDNLPFLRVDPLQIGQVLQNLITNAVQAMPDGGALRVAALRISSSNSKSKIQNSKFIEDFIEISVTDTGEGISPENMKKLFQPLFTTKAKGIGLGLVVCKNLVEANGGRIEVASESGKSTTFTVALPMDRG
ncbi:MAG: ATP-binding protein [Pedobacter sp.]